MANLTDADKVIRNDVGKSIASKLDDIADAIVAQGGGAHSLGQLSDVDIDTTTLAEGQSIVYNETTQKFENGEVSTVAALDDLTDVSITSAQKGDSLRNDGNGNWINKPTTIEMTLAEWNAIADKQAWRNAHKNTYLVISDAPNLNATAQDISYDGGADTVWDKVEGLLAGYEMIEYSDTMPTTQTSKLVTIANGVDFGYIVSAMVYRSSDARWEILPNGISFDGTAHFTAFKRDNGEFVFRPYIDSATGVTNYGGATVKVIALVKYS